jgi:hypothetical protein
MNSWKYLWIGIVARIKFICYYDVSKVCTGCEYLEDWGECHHCRLIKGCINGYYRPRSCTRDD